MRRVLLLGASIALATACGPDEGTPPTDDTGLGDTTTPTTLAS